MESARSLHARRQALAFVKDPAVVAKLFETLAPRFAQRPGGYTRIIRLGFRDGDGAQMAYLELIGSEFKPAKKEEGKKKGSKKSNRKRLPPRARRRKSDESIKKEARRSRAVPLLQ